MTRSAQSDTTPPLYSEWLSSDDLASLERRVMGFKDAGEDEFARDFLYYHVERMRILGEFKTLLLENISTVDHDPRVGAIFRGRFERLRMLDDLERSIIEPRPDVDLTEDGDYPIKAFRFNAIALTFRTRYETFSEPDDLDCAVNAARLAVTHTPKGDNTEATHHTNLSIPLQMRFDRRGDLNDLEEAIVSSRKAIATGVHTDNRENRAAQYNNLSHAYTARYHRLGTLEDNDKSIAATRQALELIPVTNRHYAALLDNLTNGLQDRYERLGQLSDLEEAIDASRKAMELIVSQDSSISIPDCQINLCNALTLRYERLGRLSDLDEAIESAQLALPGTALLYRSQVLINLGIALTLKAQHLGTDGSAMINEALTILKRAVELTPDGVTDWVECNIYLGDAFAARYFLDGQRNDLVDAVDCYRQAASQTIGQPTKRLKAAMSWARLCATNEDVIAALPAYECIVSLAPLIVWLGQSAEHRYEQVVHSIGDIISEAAATAISVGQFELAIEWLEAGRGIVWSQLFDLRSPVGDLRAVNAALADDFERTAIALQSSNGYKSAQGNLKTATLVDASDIEQASRNRRDLARQFESLLADIRALDGFQEFLHRPKLSELRSAAVDGPVLMINVHSSRCDALVLLPTGILHHVALPLFSQQTARALYSSFLTELGHGGLRNRADRATAFIEEQDALNTLQRMAECLWSQVVEPILTSIADMLLPTIDGRLPHLTWCATGHLAHLPLHAAGLHTPTATGTLPQRVIDRIVSSYTPSISALLRCQRLPGSSANPSCAPHVLVVTQANAPGCVPIPGTLREAKVLLSRLPGATTVLGEDQATVSAVREAIKESAWVHFACHGIQKTMYPTESGFALYDGPLTLGNLMEERTERVELAFLSACQTATGDSNLSDEAVHLAAGMLAVGFRAVVGTLWSIGDAEAPIVADAFYASLLEQRSKDNSVSMRTGVAYALHDAVQHLRAHVGDDHFLKWAPFVHFGV